MVNNSTVSSGINNNLKLSPAIMARINAGNNTTPMTNMTIAKDNNLANEILNSNQINNSNSTNTGSNSTNTGSNSTYTGALPPALNEDMIRGSNKTNMTSIEFLSFSQKNSTGVGSNSTGTGQWWEQGRTSYGDHGKDNTGAIPSTGTTAGTDFGVTYNADSLGFGDKGKWIDGHWVTNPTIIDKYYAVEPETNKVYTTKGGEKTHANLEVNPNHPTETYEDTNINKGLGGMLDVMASQKKYLPGHAASGARNFNPITGELLEPRHAPGSQKFYIHDYADEKNTREVWYNIGKNTDQQQHQDALNLASFDKFQNNLQKKWHTNVRDGNLNQDYYQLTMNKIDASGLTDKQKRKLEKEYQKKKDNYQKAAGGYGSDAPWEWGINQEAHNKDPNNKGPGKLFGKDVNWSQLSDPNFSY